MWVKSRWVQHDLTHAGCNLVWLKSRCILHIPDLSHVGDIYENLYGNEQNVMGEE